MLFSAKLNGPGSWAHSLSVKCPHNWVTIWRACWQSLQGASQPLLLDNKNCHILDSCCPSGTIWSTIFHYFVLCSSLDLGGTRWENAAQMVNRGWVLVIGWNSRFLSLALLWTLEPRPPPHPLVSLLRINLHRRMHHRVVVNWDLQADSASRMSECWWWVCSFAPEEICRAAHSEKDMWTLLLKENISSPISLPFPLPQYTVRPCVAPVCS